MKKILLLLFSISLINSCSSGSEEPPPPPIKYTLTTAANPTAGGTVTPASGQHNEDATVSITATPSAEYLFSSWTGATGTTATTSVVMNSNKTVTANFIKKKYALTTTVEGEGTVNEKVIKAGAATDYNSGTIVELTAVPSGEWLFVEWKGDVTGTENPTQITIDKAKSVTAVFVKKQYPLTIEIEGEGTVAEKVIKAGLATDYNSGTIVELTAEPTGGDWEFVEWTGDLTGTDNPVEITIDKAKTVKAIFKSVSPFYLDENGVTVKARSWVTEGITGELNGLKYYAVDNSTIRGIVFGSNDLYPVTTLVTDLKYLFQLSPDPVTYEKKKLETWDVNNVVNMEGLFYNSKHTISDISKWDVSSVTNMSFMFSYTSFNQDIGNWDVSNVTDMRNMFDESSSFNQDISSWNVSSVTNMHQMFQGARVFNQDISNWDVSSVTNMSSMFYRARVFNQDISSWDVSNVTTTAAMFSDTSFNQDISSWDVSSVTNMSSMFRDTSFNQDISSWDVSSVTTTGAMFYNSAFNQDISNWDVSSVTNMLSMFYRASVFNQDIGNWDVSNVTEMYQMFYGATNFNQNISKWCVTDIKSEPTNFKTDSALTEANKPVWGTCPSESTIWNGTTITFTKADGANPEEEANQDRITDNIWITRGNDGGQIFNIKTETSYNKTDSPVGTKWAVGTLDEIETLTFKKFRAAVEKPNSSLVGKNLVMYLEEDDIYLSVKFTSWSEQKNGGFAYERSTKP